MNEDDLKWLRNLRQFPCLVSPQSATINNLNFQPLEVAPRYREAQLQVGENYQYLCKLRQNICRSRYLNTHLVPDICDLNG